MRSTFKVLFYVNGSKEKNGIVWMSEMDLVELFGGLAPTLRATIKAIYKSEMLCPAATQWCDLAMPKSWAAFYNLEVVIALAFRLNTYEASRIRQKVLEALYQRKEDRINLLISLDMMPQWTEYYHNSIGKRHLSPLVLRYNRKTFIPLHKV